MTPKVSFITGVKNRSNELKETIQSFLDQDMPDWEALIVNDHSDEPIEEVVKSFKDDRIFYFELPEGETGICHARNLAIKNAKSDIMLTADGDDINRPQRARVTYEIMTENQGDAFYCNLEYFIAEEEKRWTTTFQPFNPNLFQMFNFMTGAGTAFRRSKCLEVGGYDPEFSLSEDYDMFLRIFNAGGKFCYTEEILVNYRRNPGSVSIKNFDKMHDFIMKTRIKNNIPIIDIDDAKKYALPEIAENILSPDGRKLWQDDRFVNKEVK
ncbi:MAG: glycosyltransferase [Patescibacteria group bacterium]